MCIICNAGEDGDRYLQNFEVASLAMNRACAAMLACANKFPPRSAQRRAYTAAHCAMVRIRKDWNRTEHQRELPLPEKIPHG